MFMAGPFGQKMPELNKANFLHDVLYHQTTEHLLCSGWETPQFTLMFEKKKKTVLWSVIALLQHRWTAEPEISPFVFFLFKAWCLHFPQCNLSTELHHWRQIYQVECSLPWSHKRLYTVFRICRNTPQDLWTHFDVQNWWQYPVIYWDMYYVSSVSLRLMRWFESHAAFPDKGSNLRILASHALWVKESLKLHTENWEETLSDTVCKCWLRFLSCRKFYYQLCITSMFDTRISMVFFFHYSSR